MLLIQFTVSFSFQACTGIENIDEAITLLEQNNWDLVVSIFKKMTLDQQQCAILLRQLLSLFQICMFLMAGASKLSANSGLLKPHCQVTKYQVAHTLVYFDCLHAYFICLFFFKSAFHIMFSFLFV